MRRSRFHRNLIGPLAIGTAVIGAAALTVAPAHAATIDIRLTGTQLSITADAAGDSLTLGTTAAGVITLNGAVILGGAATAATVLNIVMDGGAGADTLRLDESNGAVPPIEFRGGDGNDQLTGGSKADNLRGGPGADKLLGNGGDDNLVGEAGNDKAIGGPGNDTVILGANDDEFTWNVGDGDDRVDGDDGKDTLLFNGSDVNDRVTVGPLQGDPSRLRVDRSTSTDPARRTVSFSGFELVKTNVAGGTDLVRVVEQDIPGLNVVQVNLGTGQGDHAVVGIFEGPEPVRIGGTPASGVTVSGRPATVRITGETMIVQVIARSGDDVIDASRLTAGTVTELVENGGEGNDTLIGHPGTDQLFGENGDDRLDGRGGNDLLVP
jgi:Ca2+-binding RTX toxin-like protein